MLGFYQRNSCCLLYFNGLYTPSIPNCFILGCSKMLVLVENSRYNCGSSKLSLINDYECS